MCQEKFKCSKEWLFKKCVCLIGQEEVGPRMNRMMNENIWSVWKKYSEVVWSHRQNELWSDFKSKYVKNSEWHENGIRRTKKIMVWLSCKTEKFKDEGIVEKSRIERYRETYNEWCWCKLDLTRFPFLLSLALINFAHYFLWFFWILYNIVQPEKE